jgi:PAS domain S-box-containing protein
MTDRPSPESNPSQGEPESPTFLGGSNTPTETIDLKGLFQEDSGASASSNLEQIGSSAAGKLFEALPIPAILLDTSGRIVFANGACDRIAPQDTTLLGKKFSSLFSDPRVAENVDSRIRKVLAKRRPKVMEGVVQTGKDAVLRRLHLRSFKVGAERSVLVLLEEPVRGTVSQVLGTPRKAGALRGQPTGSARPGDRLGVGLWSMEQALKTSELTLGDVLPAAPLAISYFEQGKLKWANRKMMQMFRDETEDEWQGKSPRNFYPSDDEFERVREIVYKDLQEGTAAETEARFRRRDGSTFTGHVKVSAIDPRVPRKGTIITISESLPEGLAKPAMPGRLRDGVPDAAEGATRPPALAATEEATGVASAESFQHLLLPSSQVTMVLDPEDGTILSAAGATEEIMKCDPTSMAGTKLSSFELPDLALLRTELLEELSVAGRAVEGRHLFAVDEAVIPVDFTATEVPWDEKSAVVLTVRPGVTAQMDAQRLRERAGYYRTLLDNAPLGVIACDVNGDITEINPHALKMLGASHSDALGGLNLLTFPPFVEAGVSSVIANCFDSGKPAVSEFPNNIGLGRRRYCRLHVGPMRDHEGSIVGVQAIIEDVSKQKESETLLIQAERLKAVGEMAGGVAHNFNTLLQFVAGGSRKALGYLESKDYSKLRPLLEQIFDGARDAVQTIRRLQQFSRARRALGVSRFSHAQREVFDLSEAVREAVKKCKLGPRAELRKGRIDVSMELDLSEGCFIEGEEAEIIEVVVNLLKNAEEALPIGGKIKVKTYLKGDRAILVVQDTGVGIPSQNVGRVFEPFWTTKDTHVGMGLTSNFGIVRRHRGTITLTSTKGRGTAFTVQIPREKMPVRKQKTLEKRMAEHSFRILIIDDDEPIVRIFERGLKKLGQTPMPAFSGQEGLKLFEEVEVDAVVCDLAMPGMNGWEVARAVHQVCLERGTPKPPFILLTGWAGQLTEDEIMAHPDVNRIVEKPLKVTRLLEIVAQEVKGAVDEAAFAGRVDGIDLLEYIQVLLLTGKPAIVEVLHRNGVRGLVFIDKGRIRHAVCGSVEGEEALYRCLNMRVGSFSNLPWRQPERITIDQPTEYLLIEASRRRDEMKDGGPWSIE